MRRSLTFLAMILLGSGWLYAERAASPYMGSQEGKGFTLTVIDTDIDAAWELVAADTGFTPMSSDTSVSVAYAAQSKFDSLRAGNPGVGTVTAVFSMNSTADTTNNNFFQDRNTGTVSFVSAVFGDGASPQYNAYLTRWDDSDFNLSDTYVIAVWAKGLSAGNPGVGTTQTVFSVHESPHQIRAEYDENGFLSVVLTDDGNATIDSLTYATDTYDSTYHQIVFSCASSTISLKVDEADSTSKSLSNALQQLTFVDTLTVLGSRGGANDFRGQVDELIITEDTGTLDTEMKEYAWNRFSETDGGAADTAWVKVAGIKSSDTTYTSTADTVFLTAPTVFTSSIDWRAFEAVWRDTSDTLPLLAFSTGTTVRGAKLDSIPGDLRHYPIAHQYFGLYDTPVLDKVIYTNYGANAITYQLRVYNSMKGSVDFTKNYEIKCPAYIASGGNPVVFDFGPRGLYLAPQSYIAVWALGGGADSQGSATLIGRRRSTR